MLLPWRGGKRPVAVEVKGHENELPCDGRRLLRARDRLARDTCRDREVSRWNDIRMIMTNTTKRCLRWSVTGRFWIGVVLVTCIGCASGPISPGLPSGIVTPVSTSPAADGDGDGPAKYTVRGQGDWSTYEPSAGNDDYTRGPMRPSSPSTPPAASGTGLATPNQPPRETGYPPATTPNQPSGSLPPTAPGADAALPLPPGSNNQTLTATPTGPPPSPAGADGNAPWLTSPFLGSTPPDPLLNNDQLPGTPVPINVRVEEARTGKFMFGAGVNSEAGVTGQIIVDERNFDLFAFPRSPSDIWNGEAFRGAGQGFRLEAVPGNQVQRYLVSFTEPYLFSTPISLNTSGFYYDRGYYDWNENRLGGRLGLGYRLTPDLSFTSAIGLQTVRIDNIRVPGVPQLDEVLGSNDLYSARFSLRHDTRDLPFMPTEGHLVELSYEQTFGDFDYPRGGIDYRRYFLVRERPDGSGRHTLSFSLGADFTGSQTPIFENFFAGGFSTLRGFDFRGASPVVSGVTVGGHFRMLGSVQYMMPLTADDMIKAVAFCDFGTVEQNIEWNSDNVRIAPGFGFRINIPAMGPAPLAFDFAFPIAQADTDQTQVFSFFLGFGRG